MATRGRRPPAIQRLLVAGGAHVPGADGAIRVAGVQDGAIVGPGEAGTERRVGAFEDVILRDKLADDGLGLEVPDDDVGGGGGAEPVAVRGEHEGVDDVTGLEVVEALALVESPQDGGAVLAARGAKGAVRRDGHGVEVAGVALEVAVQAAVRQGPDLDERVPAAGHHHGHVLGEGHAGHPLGVAVLLDHVLALAEGVPELDGLVAGRRHDLAVVLGEGHGEHVLGVAHEGAGGDAGLDLPEAERGVPGAGEGELAVVGDDHIRHEVRVAGEAAAREAVGLLGAGELPDEHGLVAARGEDHVRRRLAGGDGRDPVRVPVKGAALRENLRHGGKKKKERN
mmetsp:Transcript_13440/g.39821  ORF Transcript_13440/g.39821 Transcript_13440/m.39821 type:complete len:339 (-) Transcript_13440:56-1072(-)